MTAQPSITNRRPAPLGSRARTPKAPPAPWRPRVTIVDLDLGTLLVQSQTDPAKSYICNGITGSCNCKAAINNPDRRCKHGTVAVGAWPHLVNVRRMAEDSQAEISALPTNVPAPEPLPAPLPLPVGRTREQRAETRRAAAAKYGKAAGLMEAFGE